MAELDTRVELEQRGRVPFNRDFDRPIALMSEGLCVKQGHGWKLFI